MQRQIIAPYIPGSQSPRVPQNPSVSRPTYTRQPEPQNPSESLSVPPHVYPAAGAPESLRLPQCPVSGWGSLEEKDLCCKKRFFCNFSDTFWHPQCSLLVPAAAQRERKAIQEMPTNARAQKRVLELTKNKPVLAKERETRSIFVF